MAGTKEKPLKGKPRVHNKAIRISQQAVRQMKEKYLHQLDPRPDEADNEAVDQVESSGRQAVDELTAHIPRPNHPRKGRIKEKPIPGTAQVYTALEDTSQKTPTSVPKEREHQKSLTRDGASSRASQQPTDTASGRMKVRTDRDRHQATTDSAPRIAPTSEQAAQPRQPQRQFTLNNRRRSDAALQRPPTSTSLQSAQSATNIDKGRNVIKERPRMNAAAIKSRTNLPWAARNPSKEPTPKVRPRLNQTAALTTRRTRQHAQRQIAQRMMTQARTAARATATILKGAAVAVVKAAAALIGSLVSIAGGGILLVVLVIVVVIAAVANSPFGLFFAAEKNAPDTLSVAEAVAQVNMDYNAKLEELQAGDYDSIEIHGQAPDWPDVLAVFAAKIAGADVEGMDVATLDATRVAKLKAVFKDMTAITSRVEEIDHPGDEEGNPSRTEHILHITITPKSADDMRIAYVFTAYQNSALDELLTDRAALSSLAGSLTITNADVSAILEALPDGLSSERREAVRTALQLVGKVSYFWGGKSYAIGWDSRWGTLQKVWAAGNSTTGTYRPFGLDCSGFVDWVFNNAMGHIPGHGGGASAQHTYSTDIPWADAQPGDLAFFPGDSHVGIVVGRSADGGILVCHCSYSQNNVVVTDCATTGFTAIGRPDIFS